MLPLIALVLFAQLKVQDEGAAKGQATGVNCIGTGVVCTVQGNTWQLSITGGGGSGAPTDALYWVGAANGTLTNEKNLGALSTGLVINTGGTPSAYSGTSCTNQFPRSLNASGAATCASVALGTDTTGNYIATPGGNTNEVQYKSGATTLGGMANFETDGTHPLSVPVTSHPAADSSSLKGYAFKPSTNLPPYPWSNDPTTAIPMPTGAMGLFSMSGTAINWQCGCIRPALHAGTTLLNIGMNTPTVIGGAGANAWGTGSLYARSRVVTYTVGGSTNASAGVRESTTTQTGAWLGNAAGAGGFIYWHRFAVNTGVANSRFAVGLFNTTGALTATADPNAATNSVYMGCNAGDSNFSICSNDTTSTATCNSLGASFPCTTSSAFYDLWFTAPPQATVIYYYVERLDSAATASGTISSDLPQNTVQMSWHHWVNTGSQTATVRSGFVNLCTCINM